MAKMGSTKETTVFVGDQLFTDVWGAKRTGIESWLVEPMFKPYMPEDYYEIDPSENL